jgi:hypothetical protein
MSDPGPWCEWPLRHEIFVGHRQALLDAPPNFDLLDLIFVKSAMGLGRVKTCGATAVPRALWVTADARLMVRDSL